MMIELDSLLLSAQRALTTNVKPNLRAACIKMEPANGKYEKETMVGLFIFDGECSDDERDMVDIVVTEISADFPWTAEREIRYFETQVIEIDYPQKIPVSGELVYLRYEPGYEYYRKQLVKEPYTELSYLTIRLSLQKALLGRVTPNLRRLIVWQNESLFTLYFYYDQAPSTLEQKLQDLVGKDVQADFTDRIETKALSVPYPEKCPDYEGSWCVYIRYEP